jgi:hypothetical protein
VLASRPSRFIPEEVATGPHTQEAGETTADLEILRTETNYFLLCCPAVSLKIVPFALSNGAWGSVVVKALRY